jgi:hypothetical protein
MTRFFGKKSGTIFVKKSDTFCDKKSVTFSVKKSDTFFWSKIAESHFFSVLDSPAYISANRVGNFFYIEKRPFFHKKSGKFPTHFPERYVERQFFQGSKLLQLFGAQKRVIFCDQKVFKKVHKFSKKFSPFFL